MLVRLWFVVLEDSNKQEYTLWVHLLQGIHNIPSHSRTKDDRFRPVKENGGAEERLWVNLV